MTTIPDWSGFGDQGKTQTRVLMLRTYIVASLLTPYADFVAFPRESPACQHNLEAVLSLGWHSNRRPSLRTDGWWSATEPAASLPREAPENPLLGYLSLAFLARLAAAYFWNEAGWHISGTARVRVARCTSTYFSKINHPHFRSILNQCYK